MKIALLNLPLDNNYGGNLQRYALIKVLQKMGHEVEHINLKFHYTLPWYKWWYSYPKRIIYKYVFGRKNTCIFIEKMKNNEMKEKMLLTLNFYNKYIPHTPCCTNIRQVKKYTANKYDAYVVGSDQVWRKGSATQIGLKNYLLNFTKNEDVGRYAYAVSFGVSGNLLNKKEIVSLASDYSLFNAVSVREQSGLTLLKEYGWNLPIPCLCLDPTFLLSQKDYIDLIEENEVKNLTSNRIFTYILDESEKTKSVIACYREKYKTNIVEVSLHDTSTVSIFQWLNNIRLAKFVITDSYHGCVFSIIFNRPFIFLGNESRGNSRIESLFEMLGINSKETEFIDYEKVNVKIERLKNISINFLSKIG
jgi:hypothetical protein